MSDLRCKKCARLNVSHGTKCKACGWYQPVYDPGPLLDLSDDDPEPTIPASVAWEALEALEACGCRSVARSNESGRAICRRCIALANLRRALEGKS